MIAPRLADYLAHLKQAIEDACSFVEGLSKGEFMADRRTQQAVIMSLMTISEVAARILARHPEFADRHPEVPWRQMRGMRNRLVHGYFEVDLDVVLGNHANGTPEVASVSRGHRPRCQF